MRNHTIIRTTAAGLILTSAGSLRLAAQTAPTIAEEAPSSSLMANTPVVIAPSAARPPHALRSLSMFAVVPPEPRKFALHDLVQIIVRETSQAKSSQDLETDKQSKINAKVNAWPDFNLHDLARLTIHPGDPADLPQADVNVKKNFKGEGDYERTDDLTARLTAEVIEVLPNGNLVLEARTRIKTDAEAQVMKVTGICRPADITAANTILSNQIHDLTIDKVHSGELRSTAKKGILTKVVDAIFAF